MKAFKIMVTKCANAEKRIKECPHADSDGYSHDFCGIAKLDGRTEYKVYRDNEDGLTPSCPMWSEAVEVSEIKEVVEKPKIVTRYTATIEFTEVKLKEHLLIGAGGLGYTIIGDIKEREVEV